MSRVRKRGGQAEGTANTEPRSLEKNVKWVKRKREMLSDDFGRVTSQLFNKLKVTM